METTFLKNPATFTLKNSDFNIVLKIKISKDHAEYSVKILF